MSFLSNLSNQISSLHSLGNTNQPNLSGINSGQQTNSYGQIGDLAIDSSATRSYVEEGYLRTDPYSIDPKVFEILMQQPNATILIKKSMFSSLVDNYNQQYMDEDEKLYIKTLKILLQNKCQQISVLEKLSKIETTVATLGNGALDQLMPMIITLSDLLTSSGNNSAATQQLGGVINQIRNLYAFNITATSTTWCVDNSNLFSSTLGEGTGVIELTNFTDINTSTGLQLGSGNCSFSISDPYESMLITEYDIEKAISDATSIFNNSSYSLFAKSTLDQIIQDQTTELSKLRSSRNASNITITTNANSLLGNQVTAIIDNIGIQILFNEPSSSINISSGLGGGSLQIPGLGGSGNLNISNDYLINGNIAGIQGLNPAELSAFQTLITSIYNQIQLNASTRNSFQIANDKTNYARKKLRFNFMGQLIIQQMDSVHVYISTKTMYDNKVTGGISSLFNGLSVIQQDNVLSTNLSNQFSNIFLPGGNTSFQAEKAAYVGSNFPNYLWSILRSQFVTENEGCHIFAGVITSIYNRYSNGVFKASINAQDNTHYFDFGKVNFKPGSDVWNGVIYDTLTPFKTSFDTISSGVKSQGMELLDENKQLLTNLNLRHKSGSNVGDIVKESNIFQDTRVDSKMKEKTKVLFAPDGLAYKWKQGIGVFTQFGSSNDINLPSKVGYVNTAIKPFAGQNVMNTISLLICGLPYDFSKFFKSAINSAQLSADAQNLQSEMNNYIYSLQSNLVRNNTLWGNFIPFKNLTMDEQSVAIAIGTQATIATNNAQLQTQLDQLNNNLINYNQLASAGNNSNTQDVKNAIDLLATNINALESSIKANNATFSSYSKQGGNDASYEVNYNTDINNSNSASDTSARQNLRKQLNYLTRRMSYNVRSNKDKNLFIVDDYYDNDTDMLAFDNSFQNNISLYNDEFTSVKANIDNVSHLLNMEVFADTQGHIRARFPQYNKMPSSVFYKMLQMKKSYGIQVFPDFIDQLFFTQINTLKQNLEILEEEIRLNCAALGASDDPSSIAIIAKYGNSNFNFISKPNGQITDFPSINQLATQDSGLSSFADEIQTQATSTKSPLTTSQKYNLIISKLNLQSLTKQTASINGISSISSTTFENSNYVNYLINIINIKSNQTVSKADFIIKSNNQNTNVILTSGGNNIDIFKVANNLEQQLISRQSSLKMLYNLLKNAIELQTLNSTSTSNQIVSNIYGNSNIPEVFANMIEDENYDDLGPGSGNRYIIKRAQIVSLDIYAEDAPITKVEVIGQLSLFQEGLGNVGTNGNGLTSAIAIDYDMWRRFGFKDGGTISVPFFSDAQLQCAPYAAMLLSNARKKILHGNLTISGNEYMQPGEVIYIEDRGLLFYVEAVSHAFTFGSQYHTSLTLTYGHTPGEYIPTYSDMIGKMIYNNKDIGNIEIQRQSNSNNEECIGVFILDSSGINNSSPTNDNSTPTNPVASRNYNVINNIFLTAQYRTLQNNISGNNINTTIELRMYSDSSTSDSTLSSFANNMKSILVGKTDLIGSGQSQQNSFPDDNKTITIVTINMSPNSTDRKSPSQKAIDNCRNIISTSSTDIKTALYNNIIDVYMVLTPTTES